MKQNIKKFNLLTLVLVALIMVHPITAKAASYDYIISGVKRTISVIDGETTLTVEGKSYALTRKLVAADAALDQYGTAWILFKNGAVYWWSYDLEKNSTQVEIHKLFSSTGNQVYSEKFVFEGADEVTVTGYQTSSGSKFSLLTLEELKTILNGDNTNSDNTNSDNTNSDSTNSNNTNSDSTNSNNTNNSNTNSGNSNTGNTNSDNTNTGNSSSINTNNSSSTKTSTSTTSDSNDVKVTTTTSTTTVTDSNGNTTKTSSEVTKTEEIKCARVVHTGNSYKLYSNKKHLTTAKLKNGKLYWRGYTCKNIKAIGFIKKSKNLIAITKDGKVFTLEYKKMTKKYIINAKKIKKEGKAVAFNYDKHGFVTYVVTQKPKRINVNNK